MINLWSKETVTVDALMGEGEGVDVVVGDGAEAQLDEADLLAVAREEKNRGIDAGWDDVDGDVDVAEEMP